MVYRSSAPSGLARSYEKFAVVDMDTVVIGSMAVQVWD